jgi:hypothetical protein
MEFLVECLFVVADCSIGYCNILLQSQPIHSNYRHVGFIGLNIGLECRLLGDVAQNLGLGDVAHNPGGVDLGGVVHNLGGVDYSLGIGTTSVQGTGGDESREIYASLHHGFKN